LQRGRDSKTLWGTKTGKNCGRERAKKNVMVGPGEGEEKTNEARILENPEP